jgi:phosphohistidine swiveling domain-containing protein
MNIRFAYPVHDPSPRVHVHPCGEGRATTAHEPVYVCPLSAAEDVQHVGGKASNLNRMLRLGISVPAGFVVTNAAHQRFLEVNGLQERIAAVSRDLDARSPQRLRDAARAIHDYVVAALIPEPIRQAVRETCEVLLPGSTVIVRSSAVGEDSSGASFAGQLDSYPNLTTAAEVEQALLACWASRWSERSIFYQRARGVSLHGMGVVIQEMIQPAISGVLFTRHPDPVRGDEHLLAEFCFGYGGALMSGEINPGRFTISRTSGRWWKEASPDRPPGPGVEDLLFHDAQMSLLADIGIGLERRFGSAQDIEWAMDHRGQLYFLQSRPITAPVDTKARHGRADDEQTTDEPLVLWSNANVSENFPAPISPLLYSIASTGYYHYFRGLGVAFGLSAKRLTSVEHALRNIIGVHGARMYYNLTNIDAVLRAAPLGGLISEFFSDFVGAPLVHQASPAHRSGRSMPTELFEVCVIGVKTTWQYLSLSRRVETFERTVSEFSARTRPDQLKECSLVHLLEAFRQFLDIRFNRWTNAALADAAAMTCYGALKRLLNGAFPSAEHAGLHNTLLKGLSDIVSSVPAARLWELSRQIRGDRALAELFQHSDSREIMSVVDRDEQFAPFRRQLEDFLEQWGFRCSGELMLTVPNLQENPTVLLDVLKTYIGLEGKSPADTIREQDAERVTETSRVLQRLSTGRVFRFVPGLSEAHLARLILKWTRRSIALRERARLKQALLYSRCRHIALAIGDRLTALGRLERRDDIFYLTYQEVDALVSGHAMFPYHAKNLVALRKAEHAELSTMSPPDTITLPQGGYVAPLSYAALRPEPFRYDEGPASMSGTSVCGGTALGRATILGDISEAHLLSAGDILVARQTDPGWGPVFFLISGLVLERGGMLSHGAIVAREFGIPTVVGVQDATRRIPHGREVYVDGDRGIVQIVE